MIRLAIQQPHLFIARNAKYIPIIMLYQCTDPVSSFPHQAGLNMGGASVPGFPRQPTPANTQPPNATTHEMTIPNDLIGCIIGRGGAKINEIRYVIVTFYSHN